MENFPNHQHANTPFEVIRSAKWIPSEIKLDTVRKFTISDEKENEEQERHPLAIKWLNKTLRNHIVVTDSAGEVQIFDAMENQKILKQRIEASWLYCVDSDPESGGTMAIGTLNSNLQIFKNSIVKYGKVNSFLFFFWVILNYFEFFLIFCILFNNFWKDKKIAHADRSQRSRKVCEVPIKELHNIGFL